LLLLAARCTLLRLYPAHSDTEWMRAPPADVLWFPFSASPPPAFSSSSDYFPAAWNDDMISRFVVTFDHTSVGGG
jgi:hypothetical protein